MVMVGDDFDFDLPINQKSPGQPAQQFDTKNRETTFKSLEMVMYTLNSRCPDPRFNVKMSTPAEYLDSLDSEDLSQVSMDFSHYDERTILLHPYLIHQDQIDYWTGYFDNLPQLKQLIVTAFNTYHIGQAFLNPS